MSSWKKAGKTQKTHRERSQPEERRSLGLLEKHKDYVARATDRHKKEKTIKLLRKRALDKNPDEFYFHMINSKLNKGVHVENEKKKKNDVHSEEQEKLMATRDVKYISYKRNIEAKKVEKLQSTLHLIDAANAVQNKHTFFVDDAKEAKNFDLAKRLDTHPALLDRRSNRPRLADLKSLKLPEDPKSIAKVKQQKISSYTELRIRMKREKELDVVQRKLEIKNAVKASKVKPRKLKPATSNSAPVYEWKFERKR